MKRISTVCGLMALGWLAGCGNDGTTISSVVPPTTSSATVEHLTRDGGGGDWVHTQNMGDTAADLFFIFTNTTETTVGGVPSVANMAGEADNPEGTTPVNQVVLSTSSMLQQAYTAGLGLRGTPEISEFNSHPPKSSAAPLGQTLGEPAPPQMAAVGDTQNFYEDSIANPIASTLRLQLNDGTITVNMWVANDSWSGCSKTYCMTDAMLAAIGPKFLLTGDSNDIYDWVTNLYGYPWGSHNYSNLIPESAKSTIDILFYDINADNSTTGGVLGFFYSKDNYSTNAVAYSNARLMFYMDSVLTATKEGDNWDATDYWPAEMVATLAHEFQHMIHYYKKQVGLGISTQTWLNELMSMTTEDLVADKILVNGPRGVTYSDYTAGSAGITDGRIPYFNDYPSISVTYWANDSSVLYRYAINYAFGAYLARNYGGAVLFKQIMAASSGDETAVITGLSALGYTETFPELLQRFQTAVVLSSKTTAPLYYQFNTGAAVSSTINTVTYNLGSINFYNFSTGPKTYTSATLAANKSNLNPTSSVIILAETSKTGTVKKTLNMAQGVKATVVVKPN